MSKDSKRIAIVSTGDLQNRKGFVNAFINRAKHLIEISSNSVDVYMVCYHKNTLARIIKKEHKQLQDDKVIIEGVQINIIWIDFSLIDYILYYKLKKGTIIQRFQVRKIAEKLKGYDLINVHSLFCGTLAYYMKGKYNIPYIITWHGTDIHTTPFFNKAANRKTKKVIENADMNFFVSKALMLTSDEISNKGKKMVLYNGRNERFKIYGKNERDTLREKYGVNRKKVITFAGSFFPVKNILLIPKIFEIINNKEPETVLWMIGDGELANAVKLATKGLPVTYWGNQPPEIMPEFMNCTDVFILPSKNEGLPLTIVEALACGAACVGSRVGGVPEVLGTENTFDLNKKTFAEEFANRVVELLNNSYNKIDISEFDWNKSAIKENLLISDLLN